MKQVGIASSHNSEVFYRAVIVILQQKNREIKFEGTSKYALMSQIVNPYGTIIHFLIDLPRNKLITNCMIFNFCLIHGIQCIGAAHARGRGAPDGQERSTRKIRTIRWFTVVYLLKKVMLRVSWNPFMVVKILDRPISG